MANTEEEDKYLLRYYEQYEGVWDRHIDELVGNRCTWCMNWAPLGVPIAHKDDCAPPEVTDETEES